MQFEITMYYRNEAPVFVAFIDVPNKDLAIKIAQAYVDEDDPDYFAVMMTEAAPCV